MQFGVFSRQKFGPSCLNRFWRSGPEAEDDECILATAGGSDVELSRDGDQVRQTHSTRSETLDVRAERVAELRHQVRSGTYQVPVPQLVQILASLMLRRR